MSNAKIIADEQRAADKAHHERRIQWLSQDHPVWSCGTPVSMADHHNLLERSLRFMRNKEYLYSNNSCHCTPRCNLK